MGESASEYRPATRRRYRQQFHADTAVQSIRRYGGKPGRFRTDTKAALCELADEFKPPGVAPEIAQEARDAAKQVIAGVLQNSKPFNRQRECHG